MATLQAQRVIDGLKEIGLKHGHWRRGGEFTVRTQVSRRRDRVSGRRYSEFGDALAHLYGREGCAVVAERAAEIAAKGLSVTLLYDDERKLVTAVVSSHYNPRHVVSICDGDGKWTHRAAQEMTR